MTTIYVATMLVEGEIYVQKACTSLERAKDWIGWFYRHHLGRFTPEFKEEEDNGLDEEGMPAMGASASNDQFSIKIEIRACGALDTMDLK